MRELCYGDADMMDFLSFFVLIFVVFFGHFIIFFLCLFVCFLGRDSGKPRAVSIFLS